jgi:hypothetical protein
MSDQPGESDYGYDLVHEEVAAARPAQRAAAPAAAEPAGVDVDEGGDLSYDLAHEVPRGQ